MTSTPKTVGSWACAIPKRRDEWGQTITEQNP